MLHGIAPALPPPAAPQAAEPAAAVFNRAQPPPAPRFKVSAWALIRDEGFTPLATGGQLGGSQAGFRARYQLTPALHLAARVSSPFESNLGKEAAIALDVRPIRSLPVTLTVERRIGLDRGGRDAFGVGAFGGFDRTVGQVRVDGYGQAGLVGLKRRDFYVDGALRLERTLLQASQTRLGVGAGLWGGAQPGAARLDIGPQLVARLPSAAGNIRIGAEWRQRVAGDARPGSGPVLSLGADF